MSENKNVQDTHISEQMKVLHSALIRVVSALNRPRNDEKLIAEAGIQLDRALFSILISIERLGPIGVVELAERAGRDYTTVSRQVAKHMSRCSHIKELSLFVVSLDGEREHFLSD